MTPQGEWHKAQATLYHQLGDQLKGLWAIKTNGQPANGNASVNGQHYCQEHGVLFKRHNKDGRTWYPRAMSTDLTLGRRRGGKRRKES